MPISISDRRSIEDFITSQDLVKLETRFARFNIFESLGVEMRELHHSSFLAFLLDPYESHGLRDLFLRRFLQDVVKYAGSEPVVSAIDLDLMDLMPFEVEREYQNIDILLRDSANNLAVIIENKVGSKQHSDQLNRYHEIVSQKFRGSKILGIYLTPECDDPENANYIAYSYERVRLLVLEILQRERILINEAVRSTLLQYADLLGRRFMADTELKELCANIYRRHKQAIDILIANIPDERQELATLLRELVEEAGFISDDSSNTHVRFIPNELDIPIFQGSSGWTSSGRLVLFEFALKEDGIILRIQMGPGALEKRQIVHEFALANKPLFTPEKTLYSKWQRLYVNPVLRSDDYEKELGIRKEIIRKKWKSFLSVDLPQIKERILSHNWTT